MFRPTLVLIVGVIALAGSIGANDPTPAPALPFRPPPDPAKLVGTWQLTHGNGKPIPNANWNETYTKDGKVTRTTSGRRPGQETSTGTYQLKGGQLTLEFVTGVDDSERRVVLPVHKLTDEVMEYGGGKQDGGFRLTFKRVTVQEKK